MFLLTADCMAEKGTVVPRSCDTVVAAGAASAALGAGGPLEGAAAAAAAGAGAAGCRPHCVTHVLSDQHEAKAASTETESRTTINSA